MSSTTATQALAIGQRLVEFCRQGESLAAINELYADNIVSEEAMDCPESGMPRVMEGIDAIRGKNEWWYANHEVHDASCDGPYPAGDQFIVKFDYDCTCNAEGPMRGVRMQMAEMGLYTVANGKIVREQFFYTMPGE